MWRTRRTFQHSDELHVLGCKLNLLDDADVLLARGPGPKEIFRKRAPTVNKESPRPAPPGPPPRLHVLRGCLELGLHGLRRLGPPMAPTGLPGRLSEILGITTPGRVLHISDVGCHRPGMGPETSRCREHTMFAEALYPHSVHYHFAVAVLQLWHTLQNKLPATLPRCEDHRFLAHACAPSLHR